MKFIKQFKKHYNHRHN